MGKQIIFPTFDFCILWCGPVVSLTNEWLRGKGAKWYFDLSSIYGIDVCCLSKWFSPKTPLPWHAIINRTLDWCCKHFFNQGLSNKKKALMPQAFVIYLAYVKSLAGESNNSVQVNEELFLLIYVLLHITYNHGIDSRHSSHIAYSGNVIPLHVITHTRVWQISG